MVTVVSAGVADEEVSHSTFKDYDVEKERVGFADLVDIDSRQKFIYDFNNHMGCESFNGAGNTYRQCKVVPFPSKA